MVLIFRDITERRQSERLIESAKEYAESIVTTMREPLLVLDNKLHILSANRSFYATFQVEPPEVVGRFIYDLGDGQWDVPRLRTLLESIIPTNTAFDDFEVEHDFEHIGPKTMLLNARRFPAEGAYELRNVDSRGLQPTAFPYIASFPRGRFAAPVASHAANNP